MHNCGDADTPWFGDGLEACRDVHAVAVDPRIIVNQITEVDAHAKLHAARRLDVSVAFSHSFLDCEGALDGIHDAAELSKYTVAGGVDDPSTVFADHGKYDHLMCFEIADRRFLVGTHERTVAGDVGRENCS